MDDVRQATNLGPAKKIVIARIVLYAGIVILGFTVAGLIGIAAKKEFNNSCIISARLEELACPCGTSTDCSVPGDICNPQTRECRDSLCIDPSKKTLEDTHTCDYVIGLCATSAAYAILAIAYAAFNLWKKRVSGLKANWTSFLVAAYNFFLMFLTGVAALIITVGFNKFCASGDRYSDDIGTCEQSFPRVVKFGTTERFFMDFYKRIELAEILCWVLVMLWLALGLISAIRFWWLNKQIKYKSFVNRDDGAAPGAYDPDNAISADPNFPKAAPKDDYDPFGSTA